MECDFAPSQQYLIESVILKLFYIEIILTLQSERNLPQFIEQNCKSSLSFKPFDSIMRFNNELSQTKRASNFMVPKLTLLEHGMQL